MVTLCNGRKKHTKIINIVSLCVLDISEKTAIISPILHLLNGFYKQRFNHLKPSGYYMYKYFNIQQFYILPKHCIYVFCVYLRKTAITPDSINWLVFVTAI